MCTYITVLADLEGSAKSPGHDWVSMSQAAIYFDHPVHAMAAHTLNIDISDPTRAPGERIALELTATAARALIAAMEEALAAVPPELLHT